VRLRTLKLQGGSAQLAEAAFTALPIGRFASGFLQFGPQVGNRPLAAAEAVDQVADGFRFPHLVRVHGMKQVRHSAATLGRSQKDSFLRTDRNRRCSIQAVQAQALTRLGIANPSGIRYYQRHITLSSKNDTGAAVVRPR